MRIYLDDTIEAYKLFLKIKCLPRYEMHGRVAVVPDEYGNQLGIVSGVAEEYSDYLPK